jgi:hypothetical protein
MLRRAFAANIIPALVLWSFAFGILWFYNHNPGVQSALNELAEIKNRLGLFFSMSAQALAAGLLPFLLQKLQKGGHRKTKLGHVPFLMLMFSLIGATNDIFYTFQASIFGNSPDLGIIFKKTLLDMLVYTPFFCTPFAVAVFAFKDNGFLIQKTRDALGKDWFWKKVIPVYIAALIVWTPAVCVLYALPLTLQFPFQVIVQCFWGLVLIVMTDSRHKVAESV